MSPLWGKPSPEPAAPLSHPACTCGSVSFTAGGAVVSPWHDGSRSGLETTGGVLSCLACGARWYSTAHGLRTPHRDALPPAWAMQDLQREAAEKRVQQIEDAREKAAKSGPRPVASRLSRPPRSSA